MTTAIISAAAGLGQAAPGHEKVVKDLWLLVLATMHLDPYAFASSCLSWAQCVRLLHLMNTPSIPGYSLTRGISFRKQRTGMLTLSLTLLAPTSLQRQPSVQIRAVRLKCVCVHRITSNRMHHAEDQCTYVGGLSWTEVS